MRLFKSLNLNFLEKSKYTFALSAFLVIGSIVLLSTKWLNLGLDFTGGVTVELQSKTNIDEDKVRKILSKDGYKNFQVQLYGSAKSVQIKTPVSDDNATVAEKIQKTLTDNGENYTLLSQSLVGPQIGQELVNKGSLALVLSLAGIMIYVSLRFQWKLSIGAVMALLHDLIITLGFFSLFQIDFDLTVLAALLAILGYSVNDTVVVFDRVRENFYKIHTGSEMYLANLSINQTMSRTVITSGATLLSVLALYFFGGPLLHGFSIALIVGIVIGTYSSIFVATALAIQLKLSRNDLNARKAELVDDLP